MAEKSEHNFGEQLPEDLAKPDSKKSPKEEKQKRQSDGMYLPVFVEFTFAGSMILLISVFLVMAALSIMTGASLLDFILRTGAAMGVLGILLMLISREISEGVLNSNLAGIEDKIQQSLSKVPEKYGQPEMPDVVEKANHVEAQSFPDV